jgi:hypothetical protein
MNNVAIGGTTPLAGSFTTATANSYNKMAITAPATSSTLAVADGKTLTANKTLTLDGTDSTTMTFPTTSATIARTDAAQTFTGAQTFSTAIAVGSGGTGLSTAATGAIPYGAGTSPLALLTLVANKKLFGNAAGTAPEFASGVKIINSTRDSTAATGAVAYTGVGFKPSLVIALMSSSGALGRWSVGSMDGSTQATLYTNEVPNTQISTSFVGVVAAIGGNQQAQYASFDSDGFTITWTKSSAPAADTYSLSFICFR